MLAHPAFRHEKSLDLQGTNLHQNTGSVTENSDLSDLKDFSQQIFF